MTCAEARGSIGAHLLGALDDDETGALFAHMAHCQECAAKHARLSQLVPLIDRAGPGDDQLGLPGEAEERLLDLDFAVLCTGHGAPITDDPKAAIRAALAA